MSAVDKDFPTSCVSCATKPETTGALHLVSCAGCGRQLMVCSDGAVWSATGMGMQAAEGHEYSLHAPKPKRKLRDWRLLNDFPLPGGRELSVSLSTVVVSQCDLYENGSMSNWNPFYFSLRSGRPRLQVRFSRPSDLKERSEQFPGTPIVIRRSKVQTREQVNAILAARKSGS